MQVQKVNKDGTTHWVLLDDDMHLVAPVCEFLDFQRKIARADNTLRAYALDLKIFWEYLDMCCGSYESVSADMVADFTDYLRRGAGGAAHDGGRTNRSVNRILGSIHRFYRYEQLRGVCSSPMIFETLPRTEQMYRGMLFHTNPSHRVKKSIFKLREQNVGVHIVSEEELRLFLRALGRERDRMLFLLLYYTGARIQEALDLEVSMLPPVSSDQTIGVFRQIRSKGKHRDLYAPMFLIRALHTFVNESGDAERTYLFVTEKAGCAGRQLTYHTAYAMLSRARIQTGIEFGFHDLRHTFCTRLIEQGMDVGVVSRVMGHEHLYTTKRYLHFSDACLMEYLSDYWAAQEGGLLCEDC